MFPQLNVGLLLSSSYYGAHSLRILAFEARRGPWLPSIRSVALGLLLLGHVVLAGGRHVAAAEEKELFACTFQNTALAKPWKTIGGTWQVQQGVLKQLDAGLDDPCKAVLVVDDAEELSSGIMVTAKLRLDTWKDDDQARAGVGLCCDPETGYGLNLAFNRGQLQFVHDYVTWAPGCAFSCQTGTWYWMKLCKTAGVLKGKAWRDGEPEPADWMVSWTGFDQSLTGYPALLGSSGGPGAGGSTVSFAECRVARIGPGPWTYYTKKSTWQETMAASLEALARQNAGDGGLRAQDRRSAEREPLAAAPARFLRSPIAAANGLGAPGRHLAAGRAERDGCRRWPSATPRPREPVWPNEPASLPRTCQPTAGLESLRNLYYRSREIEDTLARWDDAKVQSLRLAVVDLMRTFGRTVRPRAGVSAASGGNRSRRGGGARQRGPTRQPRSDWPPPCSASSRCARKRYWPIR